jgi:hypothetical protein
MIIACNHTCMGIITETGAWCICGNISDNMHKSIFLFWHDYVSDACFISGFGFGWIYASANDIRIFGFERHAPGLTERRRMDRFSPLQMSGVDKTKRDGSVLTVANTRWMSSSVTWNCPSELRASLRPLASREPAPALHRYRRNHGLSMLREINAAVTWRWEPQISWRYARDNSALVGMKAPCTILCH